MKLENLQVCDPKELADQTLTKAFYTHDGMILLFGDKCCHFGADTGYENDVLMCVNNDFKPVEHALFFMYNGLITEQEQKAYEQQLLDEAMQESRERDLAQLARLKRQYEQQ